MKNLKISLVLSLLIVKQTFAENNECLTMNNSQVTDLCTRVTYIDNSGANVRAIFDSLGLNMECIKTLSDKQTTSACTTAERQFLDAMYAKHQLKKKPDSVGVVISALKPFLVVGLIGSACTAIAVTISKR